MPRGQGFASALLVEDEKNLAIALTIALQKLNIETKVAECLGQAREILRVFQPEFLLLDRRLPDGDGLEICKEMREAGYLGAVLVLTASGRTEDRILGLDLGADDYLPKPFSWQELEARIRALARRRENNLPKAAGKWAMDDSKLRICGPRGWVSLTPLEYKLAARMIRSPDVIITRAQLLREVWGFTLLPATRSVDHFFGRLRRYFELVPEKPVHFLTVRGAGYTFKNIGEE